MDDLTPERMQELRRIAEEAVPGKWSGQDFQLAMTPRTALVLLDRIEALEDVLRKLYADVVVTQARYCGECGLEPGGHSKGCMMAEVERVLGLEEDGIDEHVVDWQRTAELRAQEIERLRETRDDLQLDRSDLKEVNSLLEKAQRRAGRYLEDAR